MSHFVEVLEHSKLTDVERKYVGMKARILVRYPASNRTRVYLTDNTETVLPDVALRPIPKKNF